MSSKERERQNFLKLAAGTGITLLPLLVGFFSKPSLGVIISLAELVIVLVGAYSMKASMEAEKKKPIKA